jgi:hypothetical protein
MTPLIDNDIINYEIGFAAETGWRGEDTPPFDYVQEILENRIANICAIVGATSPPVFFRTGKHNFRYFIAKKKKYKDRTGNKPYHYFNIKAYVEGRWGTNEVSGLEADDLISIAQTKDPTGTIACSRDKDARGVPGYLYSWEIGEQPSLGPLLIDDHGYLELSQDRKKLKGVGSVFFYSQCLTGDAVDSVPGLPKCGPAKAYEILVDSKSPMDSYERVFNAYKEKYNERAEEEMLEQARLLHMTRRFEDGRALLWNPPNVDYEDWIDVISGEITRTAKV